MGKLFDTDIEGRSELNEVYRTYVEAGYDLTMLELDNQRVNLIEWLRDAHEQWEQRRLNLQRYEWRKLNGKLTEDDKTYGDFEFRKELKEAKERLMELARWLTSVEMSLDSFFANPVQDQAPDNWRCVLCKEEAPDTYKQCLQLKDKAKSYEARAEHYKGVHDSARTKERKLRVWLTHSTEEQDRKALKKLDWLKGRQQLTGPWYYLLSMLIVRKHVDTSAAAKFSVLSKESKRLARKDKAQFWPAVHDRLMNFRRVNEERAIANGREWRLPHDNHVLEVKEVEYNEQEGEKEKPFSLRDYGRSTISEDAMIANIDYKKSWFLRAVMERRAQDPRIVRETSMIRKERIAAIAKKGEEE